MGSSVLVLLVICRVALLQVAIVFTGPTTANAQGEVPPDQAAEHSDDNVLHRVEVDSSPHCADWASQGECQNNREYMLTNCATSCAPYIGTPPSQEGSCLADGTCSAPAASAPMSEEDFAGLGKIMSDDPDLPGDATGPGAHEPPISPDMEEMPVEEMPNEELQSHPEELGTNPEELGTNPEELGSNPEELVSNPEELGSDPEVATRQEMPVETLPTTTTITTTSMTITTVTATLPPVDISAEKLREKIEDIEHRITTTQHITWDDASQYATKRRSSDTQPTPRSQPANFKPPRSWATMTDDEKAKASVITVYSVFQVLAHWTAAVAADAFKQTSLLAQGADPLVCTIFTIFSFFVSTLVFFRMLPVKSAMSFPAQTPSRQIAVQQSAQPSEAISTLQQQIETLQRLQEKTAADVRHAASESAQGITKLTAELQAFQKERSGIDEEMILSTKEILEWLANCTSVNAGGGSSSKRSLIEPRSSPREAADHQVVKPVPIQSRSVPEMMPADPLTKDKQRQDESTEHQQPLRKEEPPPQEFSSRKEETKKQEEPKPQASRLGEIPSKEEKMQPLQQPTSKPVTTEKTFIPPSITEHGSPPQVTLDNPSPPASTQQSSAFPTMSVASPISSSIGSGTGALTGSSNALAGAPPSPSSAIPPAPLASETSATPSGGVPLSGGTRLHEDAGPSSTQHYASSSAAPPSPANASKLASPGPAAPVPGAFSAKATNGIAPGIASSTSPIKSSSSLDPASLLPAGPAFTAPTAAPVAEMAPAAAGTASSTVPAPPSIGMRPQQQEIQATSNPFNRPKQQPIQASANPFGRPQPKPIAAQSSPFGMR